MSFCLINSINFKHNIKVVSKYIDINKIAFVIKNNAYGHGLVEMARLANESGIKHAIVISSEEAKLVEGFFDTILVLSDISNISKSKKIRIAINDLESINKIPGSTLVELKVDTGMHRNGIHINDLDRALEDVIKSNIMPALEGLERNELKCLMLKAQEVLGQDHGISNTLEKMVDSPGLSVFG